jgi:K+-sensing histidine kinase KdpD
MFLVAVVISGLTQRVRKGAVAARYREQRTLALYELSRELAGAQDLGRVEGLGGPHRESFRQRLRVRWEPEREGCARLRKSGLEESSERDTSIQPVGLVEPSRSGHRHGDAAG